MDPLILIGVFIVSTVLGYILIKNVPSLLYTPLMSGMNALSGITVLTTYGCAEQVPRCPQRAQSHPHRPDPPPPHRRCPASDVRDGPARSSGNQSSTTRARVRVPQRLPNPWQRIHRRCPP